VTEFHTFFGRGGHTSLWNRDEKRRKPRKENFVGGGKARGKILLSHSQAQLLICMKLLGVPLGLLINFHENERTDVHQPVLPPVSIRTTPKPAPNALVVFARP